MSRLFKIALLLLAVMSLAACHAAKRQHTTATLDEVESYMIERPDSALAVLEGMDSTALSTRALRARYSLLRMMALDKCYLDITAPGLLDPAIAWYEHHGTADEKLKTLFYQGRVAVTNKDRNKAALYFSRAESYVEKAQDARAVGLLYEGIAAIYGAAFNVNKKQEYIEKALAVFKQADDPIYESELADLATVYHTRREWEKADSLFREGIAHSEAYPHALAIFLSDYASLKLHQPKKDPEGALTLLKRKQELSGSLTFSEAGAYALSLAQIGRWDQSNALWARLDTLTGWDRYEVMPWRVQLASFRGDYESAFRLLTETHIMEEVLISETLADSITQTLQDYYELTSRRERERRLRLSIYALIAVVFLLSLTVILLARGRKIRMERDRLLSLRAALERDLLEQESRSAALSDDFSSRLETLRLQLGRERLDRLRRGGRYSYWMWMEQNGRSSDTHIINSLRKEFREICTLEKDIRALERRLDADLDGIVSHLKADLGIQEHSDDEKFLCYWLIDLKPDMIAELLGISTNNVYVKTHRLEKHIEALGKAEYMPLIQNNLTKNT